MIVIRYASEQDAEELRELYAYYVENTCITSECTVPDIDAFRKRIRTIGGRYPYLVAEIEGQIVGYIYASPLVDREAIFHSVQLSIYVKHGMKKSGVGKAMYRMMECVLKDMGITNMYARVAVPKQDNEYLTNNSASFHEYMGFKKVGVLTHCGYKFNQWFDMFLMEKIIGGYDENPKEVQFFDTYPRPSLNNYKDTL